GIDEVKPVRTEGCCTPHRVFIVRVPPINNDVALLCKTCNRVQRLFHDIARRDHHPYRPWRRELANQRFDRCGAGSAKCGDPRYSRRIDVVNHHSMAALNQTLCHVCAHAAQTDHSQFHIQKPRAEYSLTCGCNQCRIALAVMAAESFLLNTISILATSADLRII